jgi:hypothetical protein
MKVLNLQCAHQHDFEGWFASEDDFQGQLSRGLVECPLCGDRQITKQLSAPRLNLSAPRGDRESPKSATSSTEAKLAETDSAMAPGPGGSELTPQQVQAAWLQVVHQVMANTEDVGARFAEEARKIHYGEAQHRGIRGQATREETRDLLEEGISVMPLPIPDALKGPVQ